MAVPNDQLVRYLTEMLPIGLLLRQRRENQGLTLELVHARTKIPLHILRAIESGGTSELASGFFYRSFVRQFAAAIRVPYAEIEPLLDAELSRLPEPRLPGEGRTRPAISPLYRSRPSTEGWATSVLMLLVVTVACVGAYSFLERLDTKQLYAIAAAPRAAFSQSVEFVFSRTEAEARTAPMLLQPPAPPQRPISVSISALEQTWLSVQADGRQIYSGMLAPRDRKELEGRSRATLRTGNAGGISIVFNGRNLGTPGQRGQVRTVVFTPTQYQVLRPNLTSRLLLLFPVSPASWKS